MPADAEAPRLELFHRLEEPGSARVRRWVVDHALHEQVRFRNLLYREAAADFAACGGGDTPALLDGQRLFAGAELVIARLQAVLDLGRS